MEERNEFRESRISHRQNSDPNDSKRVIAGVLAGLIVVSAALLGLYLWIGRGSNADKATRPQAASQSGAVSSQEQTGGESEAPHLPQNFAPSGKTLPHLSQIIAISPLF